MLKFYQTNYYLFLLSFLVSFPLQAAFYGKEATCNTLCIVTSRAGNPTSIHCPCIKDHVHDESCFEGYHKSHDQRLLVWEDSDQILIFERYLCAFFLFKKRNSQESPLFRNENGFFVPNFNLKTSFVASTEHKAIRGLDALECWGDWHYEKEKIQFAPLIVPPCFKKVKVKDFPTGVKQDFVYCRTLWDTDDYMMQYFCCFGETYCLVKERAMMVFQSKTDTHGKIIYGTSGASISIQYADKDKSLETGRYITDRDFSVCCAARDGNRVFFC